MHAVNIMLTDLKTVKILIVIFLFTEYFQIMLMAGWREVQYLLCVYLHL